MKEKKQNIVSFTFDIIKTNFKTFIISFLISFLVYSFVYGIWIIPFIAIGISRMSEVVFLDYLFIFIVSLIIAVLFTLIKYERSKKLESEAGAIAVTGGTVTGIVSAVCPVCQGVVFVAFGSTAGSILLEPIIPYLGVFKIVTLGLLLLALFLKTESIYTRSCGVCKVVTKIRKANKK